VIGKVISKYEKKIISRLGRNNLCVGQKKSTPVRREENLKASERTVGVLSKKDKKSNLKV
jgi:hypothetical protein